MTNEASNFSTISVLTRIVKVRPRRRDFLLPPWVCFIFKFFRLSGVDVHCLLYLSAIAVGGCLSDVGCRVLTMDCRVLLSVVVVGFWLSCFGCRVLVFYFCVGVRSVFLISVSSSAAQYGLCSKRWEKVK